MNVIELRDVHRAYQKGRDVLAGVSFSVGQGEVVGLLGRNGAGKTTLIRMVMGMLEAQAGRLSVFGLDPREQPLAVKRRIGYVSEDQILPGFLRVGDVLRLHRGLFPSWDGALENELASRFRIDYGARVRALSKGQARQVALLCAVAHRPELLLLDEPAGGLDPAVRREFLETAIRLLAESGSTILFSSHYMADVERLAGRVVMLQEGRVLLDNELDELREAFSLVLIPHGAGADRRRLQGLAGCLSVREREDALHAIFRHGPAECRALIERELGLREARCASIPLEEMFIELAGGVS
jgi:ABC-2 type transport system ATP-binding protein